MNEKNTNAILEIKRKEKMKLENLPIWNRIASMDRRTRRCTSPQGILREVMETRRARRSLLTPPLPGLVMLTNGMPPSAGGGEPRIYCRMGWSPVVLTTQQREIRRAKNDPKFRRTFLAPLRRRLATLTTTPVGLEQVSNYADKHAVLSVDVRDITRIIMRVSPRTRCPVLAPVPGITIPVDWSVAKSGWVHHGLKLCRIGKDARVLPTVRHSYLDRSPGETEWKNGSPVSYTRATTDNYVRSFALITAPETVEVALHTTERTITVPGGRWEQDRNGLRLLIGPDDYHPQWDDLMRDDVVAHLAECVRANAERRRLAAAQAAAEKAEIEGVCVGLRDSIAAGNCEAGTRSFAVRHGLDVSRYYRATEILAMGNGDTSRVRLAIAVASHRHHALVAAGAEIYYPTALHLG